MVAAITCCVTLAGCGEEAQRPTAHPPGLRIEVVGRCGDGSLPLIQLHGPGADDPREIAADASGTTVVTGLRSGSYRIVLLSPHDRTPVVRSLPQETGTAHLEESAQVGPQGRGHVQLELPAWGEVRAEVDFVGVADRPFPFAVSLVRHLRPGTWKVLGQLVP